MPVAEEGQLSTNITITIYTDRRRAANLYRVTRFDAFTKIRFRTVVMDGRLLLVYDNVTMGQHHLAKAFR